MARTPLRLIFFALERVLGSEAGVVAANNSKNGLKSTFCPQDTPVEREALPQTLSRTFFFSPHKQGVPPLPALTFPPHLKAVHLTGGNTFLGLNKA